MFTDIIQFVSDFCQHFFVHHHHTYRNKCSSTQSARYLLECSGGSHEHSLEATESPTRIRGQTDPARNACTATCAPSAVNTTRSTYA